MCNCSTLYLGIKDDTSWRACVLCHYIDNRWWFNSNTSIRHIHNASIIDPWKHRHLVDCSWRRSSNVTAIPTETASHMEELQIANLHRRPNGRQFHSNEEGPENVPVPFTNCCWSWGRWNGKFDSVKWEKGFRLKKNIFSFLLLSIRWIVTYQPTRTSEHSWWNSAMQCWENYVWIKKKAWEW